jgi:hypothetical protein
MLDAQETTEDAEMCRAYLRALPIALVGIGVATVALGCAWVRKACVFVLTRKGGV